MNKTVLIIEDSPTALAMIKEIMEGEGYNTVTADNGEQGVSEAEKVLPHVIIIDTKLPGIDGFETCRRIKEEHLSSSPKIVITTGSVDAIDASKAREFGADDYVVKTADFTQLIDVVDILFKKRKDEKEPQAHKKKTIPSLDLESLQRENEILIKRLEEAGWAKEKTNESIMLLYQELEEKNEKLRKLDELKSQFVANVSHEIKNPLSVINESLSMLLEGVLGEINQEQKEFLDVGKRNIDRLLRLVMDLLDLSKIESGKMDIKKKKIDIACLVEEVVGTFKVEIDRKQIKFRQDIPDDLGYVVGDSDKLMQVIINLFSNAMKYTPENGDVCLQLSGDEDEFRFDISDSGAGVPEEYKEKIFDKFERIIAEKEKGTGLGLPIAKDIVSLHGGKLWVQSRKPKGSTFSFILPKNNDEHILIDQIEARIILARKELREFLIFTIKLDEYQTLKTLLGEKHTESIFIQSIESLQKSFGGEVYVAKRKQGEIIVIVGGGMSRVQEITWTMKNAIKKVFKKLKDKEQINFWYGYSIFPKHGNNTQDLLLRAEKFLVNEKKERLENDILLVDDEHQVVKLMEKFLIKVGYKNIRGVFSGEEAMEAIKEKIPDLIVLDIKMPEMNGYEVIGRLKEDVKTRNIPLIIMSGYKVESEKIKNYMQEKSISVLSKPVDAFEFIDCIDYLL